MAGRRHRRGLLLMALMAIAASGCFAGVPSPPSTPQPPNNMHLVFSDDFARSTLDTSKWDTCYPWATGGAGCTNFGNNELEWYLPGQDQVSGDALHLVASQESTAGTTRSGQPTTYPWRSGIVTMYHSLQFTYGYVEVAARVPKGAGFWPTLWLLPQSQAWPPEIDFEESYGSDTYTMFPNFHSMTTGQHQATVSFATDMSTSFHTYAVDWEPGSLTFYVDGNVVHSYNGADVPSEHMYVLANLAVSGTNPPNSSTSATASLDIDSVRVYQH